VGLIASLSTFVAIAAVITGVAAIIAIYLGFRQQGDVRREAKYTRTFDYVTRFSEPQRTELLAQAREFIELDPASEEEADERWRRYEDDPEVKKAVNTVFNFYEEVAVMFNRRLVDSRVTRDLLAPDSVADFDDGLWLIRRRRQHDSPECWVEWERMNRSFRPHLRARSRGAASKSNQLHRS
jgi:hypothetical protein